MEILALLRVARKPAGTYTERKETGPHDDYSFKPVHVSSPSAPIPPAPGESKTPPRFTSIRAISSPSPISSCHPDL